MYLYLFFYQGYLYFSFMQKIAKIRGKKIG